MSESVQALESAALLLPTEERARLAERLIASLDVDPDVEAAWAVEVRRRVKDWEAGLIEEIPADEALARIRARLSTR